MPDIDRSISAAQRYGVSETNPLWMSESTHHNVEHDITVRLDDPRIEKVTRIRLLGGGEPIPFYDVSYAYAKLKDGRHVRLDLGAHQLPKATYKGALLALAKEAGVYAKGLGMFDVISILS